MYNVKITDEIGNVIAERFDVTNEEVRKYLSKGFRVIDINTHKEITESVIMEQVGISECVIA